MSSNSAIATLRSPKTIRLKANEVLSLAKKNQLAHWQLNPAQWPKVVDYVYEEIRANYPDFNIPRHSRLRHIGDSRWDTLAKKLSPAAALEYIMISVLLDAGAGMAWRYTSSNGETFSKSEGLAIAAHEMFLHGHFSAKKTDPLRVDGAALTTITESALATHMQVTAKNPLLGLKGRCDLLQRLGHLIGPTHRLGDLLEPLLKTKTVSATTILATLLSSFSEIWPDGFQLDGINIGDVGEHAIGLIPFHKLSQWLVYSLADALESLDYKITELDQLTGLPEYRNGGLLVDLGLLTAKQPSALRIPHPANSEWVVEWRALTVALLDELSEHLKSAHPATLGQLELAQILQGGSWSAGRKIAASLRTDGGPPFQVISTGTLF